MMSALITGVTEVGGRRPRSASSRHGLHHAQLDLVIGPVERVRQAAALDRRAGPRRSGQNRSAPTPASWL